MIWDEHCDFLSSCRSQKPSVIMIEQPGSKKEREAAVAEASSDSPTSHPVPSAVSSPRVEFNFSELTPADVSADSNFTKMNVDGNVTNVSAFDNLSSEDSYKDSSKATEEDQWWIKFSALKETFKRTSEPP